MSVILTFKSGKDTGRRVEFADDESVLVGRSARATLRIADDPLMEDEHFIVERSGPSSYVIRDLDTARGTFVNRDRIGQHPLKDGDVIFAGLTTLRCRFSEAVAFESQTVILDSDKPRPMDDGEDTPNAMAAALARAGYLVDDEIGRGAFARAYRAIRQADGRLVVVKVLERALGFSPQKRALFLREVSVLKGLDHPHIVRFLDESRPDEEIVWYAMEHFVERDLSRLVRASGGSLDAGDACTIVLHLLDALDYAHHMVSPASPFVHRDVKPENVLVGGAKGRYYVKLVDFGLAKEFGIAGISDFTMTGEVRGTMEYMAPEQAQDSKYVGPEVDLYAAGCVFYFCFSGRSVYRFTKGMSGTQRLETILNHDVVAIRESCPHIPAGLARVMEQAISHDVNQRFRTAKEMKAAVARAMSGGDGL